MSDPDLIRAVIVRYFEAYGAHDAPGCAEVYAPGALLLSPWGPPVRGTEAIANAHLDWFGEGEINKVFKIDDLLVDGDLGVCVLRYEADIPSDHGRLEKVFGASLNTLCRQTDGSWKIHCTSINELEGPKEGFEK